MKTRLSKEELIESVLINEDGTSVVVVGSFNKIWCKSVLREWYKEIGPEDLIPNYKEFKKVIVEKNLGDYEWSEFVKSDKLFDDAIKGLEFKCTAL